MAIERDPVAGRAVRRGAEAVKPDTYLKNDEGARMFKRDLFKHLSLTGHPKAEQIYEFACDDTFEEWGYAEIYAKVVRLMDLTGIER